MQRTVSNYKRSILTMKADIDKILGKVNYFHANHREALNREIKKYEKRLHQILAIRRQKKYEREIILMLEKVIHHHYLIAPLKMEIFEKKILVAK